MYLLGLYMKYEQVAIFLSWILRKYKYVTFGVLLSGYWLVGSGGGGSGFEKKRKI